MAFRILCFSIFIAVGIVAHAEKITSILGAGATFPAPYYQKCFLTYKAQNPSIEITYNPIGSGGGIKNLIDQTVDFGASDAPMTDTELKGAKEILHIPTVMGAVAITQNLGPDNIGIKLSAEVLAGLFLGEITKWNDKRIADLNPGKKLPDLDVVVVYRADSSGTTNVFTEYLAKVSESWKQKVGSGKTVKWPVGQGNKGNQGVASVVKNTPGAVGYVELVFAEQEHMAIDEIKNKTGKFVKPSLASVTAAAADLVKTLPSDFRVSMTNPGGTGSYPIAAMTYLLVYKEMERAKGLEIIKILNWMMKEGQALAPALFYAPLPKGVLIKVKEKIKSIQLKAS